MIYQYFWRVRLAETTNQNEEIKNMSGLKKHIYEEKNGLHYTLNGDYYLPDLKLPEEHRPIGKYGRMNREYLREVHPARLNTLILTGELWTYLADLNEQAQERLDTIKMCIRDRSITTARKLCLHPGWHFRHNSL